MRRLAAALALLLAGCRAEEEPPYRSFLPLVQESRAGELPRTRLELTNPTDAPAVVTLHRWPPDRPEYETETIALGPGETRRVAARIPRFPVISSFLLTSGTSFQARLVPYLAVPVLSSDALARPGDRLRIGPFVKDGSESVRLGFSFPWTDRDAVPFKVRAVFRDEEGRELRSQLQALSGTPQLVDPWETFSLPPVAFHVELTLQEGPRGRRVRSGLWAFGLAQDLETGSWRLLEPTLERGR